VYLVIIRVQGAWHYPNSMPPCTPCHKGTFYNGSPSSIRGSLSDMVVPPQWRQFIILYGEGLSVNFIAMA